VLVTDTQTEKGRGISAFTLVEMLVVIGIVAILAAITFPGNDIGEAGRFASSKRIKLAPDQRGSDPLCRGL
jgi:prepilin-type N-terminal cleavage/methylation domain-containing protein